MKTWICIDPISALGDAAGNQLLAGLCTAFELGILANISHLLLQSNSCLLKTLAEMVSKVSSTCSPVLHTGSLEGNQVRQDLPPLNPLWLFHLLLEMAVRKIYYTAFLELQ